MPKGSPKPQTIASAKYQEKVGLMSKTYKLQKNIVDEFSETCKRMGVSQSGTLMHFMQEFCEKNKTE